MHNNKKQITGRATTMAPSFHVSYWPAAILVALVAATVSATPLDDYVNMPDNHYEYTVLKEYRIPGEYTAYVVNMTSQKWLTYNDSDSAIWFHYLTITIPEHIVSPEHAFLFITGGSTKSSPPDPRTDKEILRTSNIALGAGIVGATLRQVPNQPIVFKTDPLQMKRYEDEVIAFTWHHFLYNGTKEPNWLLRLPMTKAAVRAMDTISDVVYDVTPNQNISKFIVAGESKRGWATWTTGAVDKRVVAIAPICLDLLNMAQNMHHHYRSLGGWTMEFNDYYAENITLFMDTPELSKMAAVIDAFAYKDRLTMPKFIVTAGSDEFFLPDDSYYYFNELPGPKYLSITPNDEHELRFHNLELTHQLTSFVRTVIRPTEWTAPTMTWKRYENSTHGILEFLSDPVPLKVEVFRTLTNRGPRRDFRLAIADPPGTTNYSINVIIYKKFPNRNPEPGKYIAEFLTPREGWQCFFIRAQYNTPGNTTITFTTEASITPANKFAVPECHGIGCKGILV
ncbi:autocrine proliferation repressor protein A-like [Lytechinus pictus]|uniref:autocrine proliferation repressor protein A-like n=1 Tax=Lytechinus pictus TaxID=7653 RepID=UPI0030B9DB43